MNTLLNIILTKSETPTDYLGMTFFIILVVGLIFLFSRRLRKKSTSTHKKLFKVVRKEDKYVLTDFTKNDKQIEFDSWEELIKFIYEFKE